MPKRYDNEVVLFFSCTHAPYHHKDTLDFLNEVKNYYNPDRVIHAGDLLDIYSVSDYPKDLNHRDTWKSELKGGLKFVKQLGEMFPELTLLESNHDARAYKKSRVAGVPREFLVPYLKLLEAPEGWRLKSELNLTVETSRDQYHFAHTISSDAITAAKMLGRSVMIGHNHTKLGLEAFNNGMFTVWGGNCGCLISDKGSPFKYNKTQIGRPIRGCIVIMGGIPTLIPMNK